MTAAHLSLALLRERDRELHDLVLESVGGRIALATVLVDRLGGHASAVALDDERNRVRAHLHVAEAIGPQGLPVALEAIKSGARLEPTKAAYQAAADSRRTTKLALVAGAKESA